MYSPSKLYVMLPAVNNPLIKFPHKEKKHRKHSKSDSHVTTISRQDIEMGEKKSMDIEDHLSELNQINQISRDIAINIGTNNLDNWNAFINLASSDEAQLLYPVSYTHLTLPTKRIV